jgi:hypothetical protein
MFRSSEFPIATYLDKLESDYRGEGLKAEFEPFTANAEFVPILRNVTQGFTNVTDADTAFAWWAQMQDCRDVATLNYVPFPDVLVQVRLDAGGRDMQNVAGALVNTFGNGERPFEMPRPVYIGPKSSWTTTCQNRETGFDFNLRLSFHGVKIYLSRLG